MIKSSRFWTVLPTTVDDFVRRCESQCETRIMGLPFPSALVTVAPARWARRGRAGAGAAGAADRPLLR
eukprot:COSAG02_NODE_10584_length_1907_cov_10.500000_2_plen_68_part_00